MTKIDKFLIKVLKKQFSLVKLKYSAEFVKKKEWYLKKSWNEETEKKFKDYFIAAARKDLKWSKRLANKEYLWFNLNYGWKQK